MFIIKLADFLVYQNNADSMNLKTNKGSYDVDAWLCAKVITAVKLGNNYSYRLL